MSHLQQARVRFAPAPTGMMHLGNVRTALINFIFARQKAGTFIVRIEDTDQERNYDPHAHHILEDLSWLGLSYDEGPHHNGPYGPYFQSQRTGLYADHLDILKKKNLAYPCFCTVEELERKKERQITLRLAPRYDGTCARLTPETQAIFYQEKKAPVWRMRLDHGDSVTITDLARGTVTFELKNFSDFLLTRSDGGFTFIFANFVDDMLMKITHVFRGEDHLSNTANQAALYKAFHITTPIFWHMPIICNSTGSKLSKRDFGFSLRDLRKEGYLPQAINNYLAVLGGSFEKEIMTLDELVKLFPFNRLSAAGQIRYDNNKLTWFNQKWIAQMPLTDLALLVRPYLEKEYGNAVTVLTSDMLEQLCALVKTDMAKLSDSAHLLAFYFREIENLTAESCKTALDTHCYPALKALITAHIHSINEPLLFLDALKKQAQANSVPLKQVFHFLRLSLIGTANGPTLAGIIALLGTTRSAQRIKHGLSFL